MLSKNKQKQIQGLIQKKNRVKNCSFIAEGDKLIVEALHSKFRIKTLLANDLFLSDQSSELLKNSEEIIPISDKELQQISFLKTHQNALAVIEIPKESPVLISSEFPLSLGLDQIQDPGNLGTIIRLADWFGIEHIFCNTGTTDCYSPKVVQASMGAIFRIQIHYVDFMKFLPIINDHQFPVYGTFLEGENIYQQPLSNNGLLILGNEGNGISAAVAAMINNKLHIPSFSTKGTHAESLNVATATAICCSEFKRRRLKLL